MPILKNYQEKAVSLLLDHACEALAMSQTQIPILLKAPTGAGKTVTMAAFLSRLIREVQLRPATPKDLAFIWIAPNTLHLQSYRALNVFYEEMRDIRTLQVEDLDADSVLQPADLLFLNWSSIDKDKNIFRRENEAGFYLESLIRNTKLEGRKIIVIIDEAHYSAYTGEQAQKALKLIEAKLEISISATPLNKPDRIVAIDRENVVKAQMIKKGIYLNIGVDSAEQNGKTVDRYLLRKAMEKRDELAEAYKAEELRLNPLLLIQLPSENQALSQEDRNKYDLIVSYLAQDFGITTENALLAVWLSDAKDKHNLAGLEKHDNMTKVLIFKQAIAQGWDCPRASVLLMFRDIKNANFGIQTVGRILRMPEQKHYSNDLLNVGYVYTDLQSAVIQVVSEDLDYFTMQTARRKAGLVYDRLNSITMVNDRKTLGVLTNQFFRILCKLVEEKYEVQEIPDLKLFTEAENVSIRSLREQNKRKFEQKNWHLEIKQIDIPIMKDLNDIDFYETGEKTIQESQISQFARTYEELSRMFDKFCYQAITRLNRSKSFKTLRSDLIKIVEYYMGFPIEKESDIIKILLYPQNQILVIELVTLALERFDAWQKERGNENRRKETVAWEVPEERNYTEIYEAQKDVSNHALEPYYELKNVSNPEKLFARELEKNAEYIDWWYKNGDHGKEHFAVSYTNSAEETALFYVDFIVKFRSGMIGLFDTKTSRSDSEAPQKHNALIEYLEIENEANPTKKLMGSIIISQKNANQVLFRYTTEKISDTKEQVNWHFFQANQF